MNITAINYMRNLIQYSCGILKKLFRISSVDFEEIDQLFIRYSTVVVHCEDVGK